MAQGIVDDIMVDIGAWAAIGWPDKLASRVYRFEPTRKNTSRVDVVNIYFGKDMITTDTFVAKPAIRRGIETQLAILQGRFKRKNCGIEYVTVQYDYSPDENRLPCVQLITNVDEPVQTVRPVDGKPHLVPRSRGRVLTNTKQPFACKMPPISNL